MLVRLKLGILLLILHNNLTIYIFQIFFFKCVVMYLWLILSFIVICNSIKQAILLAIHIDQNPCECYHFYLWFKNLLLDSQCLNWEWKIRHLHHLLEKWGGSIWLNNTRMFIICAMGHIETVVEKTKIQRLTWRTSKPKKREKMM